MSVIVKGMEMPTTCCNCKFREPFIDFAYCHLAEMDMEYEESDNCRHPDCLLVEIPTPHGRLIDAEFVYEICGEKQGRASSIGEMQGISKVWKAVKRLPTVIEPEGSEE